MLIITIFIVLAFIFCLLFVIIRTLNKQYIITSIDNDSNFQLAYIDIVTYCDETNDYSIDERKYLDITLTSFTLFICFILFVRDYSKTNFFEKYFSKKYKTIIY